MKHLMFVIAISACGGGHQVTEPLDARGEQDAEAGCSVLTQAGCGGGEKCTWVLSTDPTATTPGLGTNACVPDGGVAVGESCTTQPVAMGGFDNCIHGTVCVSGVCKAICDNNGGSPACGATKACVTYDGLFANSGATTVPAGVCDPSCNPLDDNDFDGSGVVHGKTGTACGTSSLVGCHGFPSSAHTTVFTCAPSASGTGQLVHRSAIPAGQQFLNSCMPGYQLGVRYDSDASMQIDCFAFCKPGESAMTISGGGSPNGVSPHRCNNNDALGDFSGGAPTGSPVSNGEHCWYSWYFEIDASSAWHRSPTSDTVGICIDHTKYHWDSNHDSMIDAGDMVYPPCASLPVMGTATTLGAADLGCVDSATAGLTSAFTAPALIARRLRLGLQLPEFPALPLSPR